jgi:hypothetical protein
VTEKIIDQQQTTATANTAAPANTTIATLPAKDNILSITYSTQNIYKSNAPENDNNDDNDTPLMNHQSDCSDDEEAFVYDDGKQPLSIHKQSRQCNSLDYDDNIESDDGISEDDDGDHLMSFQPIHVEPDKKRDYEIDFKVLNPQRIIQMQNEEIDQVSMLCGLSREQAALLLRHFR